MKKLFTTFIAVFLMSFQSLSADGYIASYSIKVSDVQTFAKSFDELMTSNFGQEFPGTVTLGHFAFNGYDDASHAVVISYDSEADMAKGTQMFYTPTFGKFLNDVQSISEPIEQSLNRKLISGGNNNQADNSVYTTYYMSVKNPKKYAAAWSKLIDAQVEDGNISGSYGLRAHTHGDVNYYSHYVYTGSSNIEMAVEEQKNLMQSESFKMFSKNAKREVKKTTMMVVMATYNYPNS
jgi:hypothetical protein